MRETGVHARMHARKWSRLAAKIPSGLILISAPLACDALFAAAVAAGAAGMPARRARLAADSACVVALPISKDSTRTTWRKLPLHNLGHSRLL